MLCLLVFVIVIGVVHGQDFNPRPRSERQPVGYGYSVRSQVPPNSVERAFVEARQQLASPPAVRTTPNEARPFTAESAHAIFQAPNRMALQLGREQMVFETATRILSEENQMVTGGSAFSISVDGQGSLSGGLVRECASLFNSTVCDFSRPYRSLDGTCNNMQNIYWGRTLTCFPRLLPPTYGDDLTSLRLAQSGEPLPNAREISLRFHSNTKRQSEVVSHMHMQFGQFLDHDITLTPISRSDQNTPITCCPRMETEPPECAAIDLSPTDPYFSNFGRRCLSFVRSLPCPFCSLGPRQQLNQQTAFIDGSQIYGASEEIMLLLRTNSGDGKLAVVESDAGPLLPRSLFPNNDECSRPEQNQFCFEAGDQRVNVQPGLTCMHTVFVRHHNNIVDRLRQLNPRWDGERLFQEARKIVGAQLQMIVYNEYLPPLLGERRMDYFALSVEPEGNTEYDPTTEPTLANEFSAAAFRYGHSMINGLFSEFGARSYDYGHQLRDIYFNPFELYRGRMEPFLKGFIRGRAQQFDRYMEPDVTNYLYRRQNNSSGLDLAAFNIQRGRDHGIPGYPRYVEFCGGPSITTFADLNRLMSSENRRILESLYRSVEDIDLFTGGLAETPRYGSLVGPTFSCIIGIQFYHLKYGDRFYFEHYGQTGSFTPEQLSEIRKTCLASILCETTTISEIYPEAMKYQNSRNNKIPCSELPPVDLSAWAE